MQFSRLNLSTAPAATLLVRLMVGGVFLSEGLQKFLRPDAVGAGRFATIGLPSPEVLAPLVGGFEIACGLLVLLGLWTRLATLPLLAIISTAIVTTKIPVLLHSGFWNMAHEARTDFSMLLGALFLLMVGAGPLAWDARRSDHEAYHPVRSALPEIAGSFLKLGCMSFRVPFPFWRLLRGANAAVVSMLLAAAAGDIKR
jgi:putative oxidoreductase